LRHTLFPVHWKSVFASIRSLKISGLVALTVVASFPAFAGFPVFDETNACFPLMRPRRATTGEIDVQKLLRQALSETAEAQSEVESALDRISWRRRQRLRITARDRPLDGWVARPTDFEATVFRIVGTSPAEPAHKIPQGGKIIRSLDLGYVRNDGYHAEVPIQYLVIDAEAKVREVAFGSAEALEEFRAHLFGRAFSPKLSAKIEEVNRKIFQALAAHPQARAKVQAFAKARGWPEGVTEAGRLVYYDETILDLKAWAKANGYRLEDLRDAGWLLLTYDKSGRSFFRPTRHEGIRIPYGEGDSIPIWRTRNTGKSKPGAPKYLSWQLDRSINREFTVAEKLYQSGLLRHARGQTVVITEGEFKCLVATKITGIPVVGIPGITQFDSDLAKTLVESGAKEFVVILDRDPKGKAMLRADGVSDSERAAYAIAKDLEAAGATRVRVGSLPAGAAGEKLGIDDLILKYGDAPFRNTIDQAVDAESYARRLGLDTSFMEVARRRAEVRRALTAIQAVRERGETIAESLALPNARLRRMAAKLNEAYSTYLDAELGGAASFQQADARWGSIGRVNAVPDPLRTKRFHRSGQTDEPLSSFADEMLMLDYAASDLRGDGCFPVPCSGLPYSSTELRNAFDTQEFSGSLASDFEQGSAIAARSGFTPKSYADFLAVVSAGRVAESFPIDDYRYVFGGRFARVLKEAGREKFGAPLMIAKKDTPRAVAFVRLFDEETEVRNSREQFGRMYRFLREP
jgi:hypothetical protein